MPVECTSDSGGLDEVDARPSTPLEAEAHSEDQDLVEFTPDPTLECCPEIANNSETYSMSHPRRGVAFVLNHFSFHTDLRLGDRKGTNRDRDSLEAVLESLGFEVRVLENPTLATIKFELEKCAREDHSDADCFLLAVLTHGELGKLYSKNEEYSPDVLWSRFTDANCPSLKGKPRLFFVQACQGDRMDGGVRLGPLPQHGVQPRKEKQVGVSGVDGVQFSKARPPDSVSYKLLQHAHFLIAYATIPGYYSWRHKERGSWFIQSLCGMLKEEADRRDLRSILTRVAKKVALEFESSTEDEDMNKKKQIPCIASTLAADVYLAKSYS